MVTQASAGLHLTPWLLVLLSWPCQPLTRLHSSLQLWVGLRLPPPTRLWQLRCLVRCRSLRGPQPVAPRHLRSLNVRRSAFRHSLSSFPPGFRLSTPGCMFGLRLYIAVRRLYRLFCPVLGDAVRLPLPRCHSVRF